MTLFEGTPRNRNHKAIKPLDSIHIQTAPYFSMVLQSRTFLKNEFYIEMQKAIGFPKKRISYVDRNMILSIKKYFSLCNVKIMGVASRNHN